MPYIFVHSFVPPRAWSEEMQTHKDRKRYRQTETDGQACSQPETNRGADMGALASAIR